MLAQILEIYQPSVNRLPLEMALDIGGHARQDKTHAGTHLGQVTRYPASTQDATEPNLKAGDLKIARSLLPIFHRIVHLFYPVSDS